MGATAVLSARELNRATLARQMLLERAEDLAVPAAVQRLGGMQAQEPKHPFVGLWSRTGGFSPEALLGALAKRSVVRATLMRSTLHLFSAADYVALRLALQPPASAMLRVLGRRAEGLDPDAVVVATRRLLADRPLTFDAIRAGLQEHFPDVDERALGYAARTLVPLVMVPDSASCWGYPRIC
ncbi:MAG: winged helix DNA-binding domain-containing protein, partial [Actinobacteria bacterium]|nr:winged helix DNA-binding domain-containing protein [Actinomycetota bacterium]